MNIKKEILIKGRKAVLTYNDNMFGKDANTLVDEAYEDVIVTMSKTGVQMVLVINGEEVYNDVTELYEPHYYFELVDRDMHNNELSYSETIYETVNSELELVQLIIGYSDYVNNMDDYKVCPKGFVNGNCDQETSDKCEYSALTIDGLCGAECVECSGDMLASIEKNGYVCECSNILFEDRHKELKAL